MKFAHGEGRAKRRRQRTSKDDETEEGLVPPPSLLRHWKVLICQSKHQNAARPILYVPANDAEARRRLREQPEDSHFSKRYLRR